jgi:hypothetical protein
MLLSVPMWWFVIGCVYHDLAQLLSYLAVAGAGLVAYFYPWLRARDK